MQIPPELMAPEQREKRAAELEREIRGEWLRFAIVEFVLVTLPLGLLFYAYLLTDWASESLLVPLMIAVGWLCIGLVTYWMVKRVQPRQKELHALRKS